MRSVRPALPLVLATGLLLSLAACTPGGDAAVDCEVVPSGSVSDGIDIAGDWGTKPEVTFSTPTSVGDTTQRTTVIEGDGEPAVIGTTANVNFVLLNGSTGAELAATEYGEDAMPTGFPVDETAQFLPGVIKTLECSTVGSRVVGVIPAAESYGDAGNASFGVEPGQDIVFVADIISVDPAAPEPLSRADGEDQPPVEGLPTVVLDDDGRPTITIPDAEPPAELELAVLKEGSGATVEPGSDVVVHYVGMNWNTGEIFDESWARGQAATFNTAAVIPGFTQALEGQKVGSQVVVVIPPDLGYGPSGGNGSTIGATDTIVFVIDILGLA